MNLQSDNTTVKTEMRQNTYDTNETKNEIVKSKMKNPSENSEKFMTSLGAVKANQQMIELMRI
jgi:hypothetical protein